MMKELGRILGVKDNPFKIVCLVCVPLFHSSFFADNPLETDKSGRDVCVKFATDGGKGRRGVGVTVFYRVTAWASQSLPRSTGTASSSLPTASTHRPSSPPLLLGEIRAKNRCFEANFILRRFFAS
jgi:hypothetical protein